MDVSKHSFDIILHKIRTKSKDEVEKGTKFEILTKLFLETASPYSNIYKNVCLWKDWKYNDGHDTGIDLMADTSDGNWCAIQCKCYADDGSLDSRKIDSFFSKATALEKKHKKKINLLLVYTGDRITSHAAKKIKDHQCRIINQQDIREKRIQWENYPNKLTRIPPQELRDYQKNAVNSVINKITNDSRGKLVMACGTGKTLTSLRIAEKYAGVGKTILYLVPSITLIQQTLQSWSENAKTRYHYEAVCSDSSVNAKSDDSNIIDDGNILDIPIPATTNVKTLKERIGKKRSKEMTVLFSTYHSLDVVQKAMNGKEIDLILCDEAHRTTGIEGEMFQKVHDNEFIKAKKRLYMTATPKQFTEKLKRKHVNLVDMDDEEVFGKSLYNYSFTSAVDNEDLCDFKVRVPVFREGDIEQYRQESLDGIDDGKIDERVLLAAVWHALNYGNDETKLLQRVIAFGNTIKASEKFSGIYNGPDQTSDEERYLEGNSKNDNKNLINRSMKNAVNQYEKRKDRHTGNTISVRHVDGTMSSNIRHRKMDWLKSSSDDPRECRILSNARCLSEGVDVPALDGIIFLQPRKSQVDVIQAVGRVMRKVKGKDYGHVIIPVVLQKDTSLHESLENTKAWKGVWDVLKALRSHDPDFGKKIDKLALMQSNGNPGNVPENIEIIFMGSLSTEPIPELLGQITSQMIKKCGDREYFSNRSKELGSKAKEIEEILSESYKKTQDKRIQGIVNKLHDGLKTLINDSVSVDATLQVMAQHYALSQVFNALFQDEFIHDNPIVRVLDDATHQIGLYRELDDYKDFFDNVRKEVGEFRKPEEKETYIKNIYDSFLKGFDKKRQESEGIVYTPNEVVDFIIYSIEHVLEKEFDAGFDNKDVKVFDPFTGTGTFIARLFESGLITQSNLETKYRKDIWANEITLLAYYVAAVNIESVFKRITGKYKKFKNINYTDTLNHHPKYRVGIKYRQKVVEFGGEISKAQDVIRRSKMEDIDVIFCNPPYSSGQKNANDENPNTKYFELDNRIKDTYIDRVKIIDPYLQRTASLYDSYIRSIRWASDRIGNAGIIGFVTNASFIRSEVTAGLRACLEEEFTDVWCFDLRGNQRTQGEVSKKEGGKIFGSGSRAPVAITILVKNPNKKDCTTHYKDIGDYHNREKKLDIINKFKSISGIKDWQIIKPDKHYDWLNHRDDNFSKYTSIGSKDVKSGKIDNAIFRIYSQGVATSRDAWVYNSSQDELGKNMKRHIDYCNNQDPNNPKIDSIQAKMGRGLYTKIKKFKPKFDKNKIRISLYRPFFKQYLYFDVTRTFNNEIYQMPKLFPKEDSENLVIIIPYKYTGESSTFVVNITPDLEIVHHGQCFPLYTYPNKDDKKSNITGTALTEYQQHYNDKKITRKSIFYYVYGLLHHTKYKQKFANNLMRELPRIPMALDFWKFSIAGEKLAELHLNYETCKRYNLGKPKVKFGNLKKMAYSKMKKDEKSVLDKTKLKINEVDAYENIPLVKYQVNGRTPLEWLIDRYKLTTDTDSGITNNPTKDMTEQMTIEMIERILYVSIESDKIIEELSKLPFEPKNWTPRKTGIEEYLKDADGL